MKNLFIFPTRFFGVFLLYLPSLLPRDDRLFRTYLAINIMKTTAVLITAEVNSLLSDNELAFTYWKRSRTYNTIAFASSAIAVGTGIAIVTRDAENPRFGRTLCRQYWHYSHGSHLNTFCSQTKKRKQS